MTDIDATLPGVSPPETTSNKAGSPERAAVRELVRAARARGEDLTGPDGLLKVITKTVLESALEEELAEHLGFDKHQGPKGRWEHPQRDPGQDGADRGRRGGADRGAAGPGGHVRPADRQEAAAPVERRRRGGDLLVCQGPDHRGDQRPLRRGLRRK